MRTQALLLIVALAGCVGGSADGDGDGIADVEDCGPDDPSIRPGALEIEGDGIDQDCDGQDLQCDRDGDGARSDAPECGGTDCDDTDDGVEPTAAEACNGRDDNCDGNLGGEELDADGDGYPVCAGDCDDLDPDRAPDAGEVCDGSDNNCDGVVPPGEADADSDGFLACAGDCDDSNSQVWPGAPELCDGFDNDCDGAPSTDEVDADGDDDPACTDCDDDDPAANSLDQDGDGASTCGADGVAGTADDDCDDDNPQRFVGNADDPFDGVDGNCDGIPGVDMDGDGFAFGVDDCDDADATRAPGAAELCDGIDQDCDGVPSPSFGGDEADADGDGLLACAECDDDDPTVFPGAAEACDGVDTDCDGLELAGDEDVDDDGDLNCSGCPPGLACGDCDDGDASLHTLDLDGDGETSCDSDCDDTDALLTTSDLDADNITSCDGDCSDFNPTVRPGVPEVCDGEDTDCDGVLPSDETDSDGDVWIACADCDDSSGITYPGAAEVCDGLDNDCNGEVPHLELDGDLDGFVWCTPWLGTTSGVTDGGDCGIDDPLTHPGAPEQCDLIDNDCDGVVDEGVEADGDGDGWFPCQGDCDDLDALRFPFNLADAELAGRNDGLDANCDGDDAYLASGGWASIEGPQHFASALSAGGDLDGDGIADLLVVNSNSLGAQVDFFLGAALAGGGPFSDTDAHATLVPPAGLGLSTYPRSVLWLDDLDGDGLPEAAVGGAGPTGTDYPSVLTAVWLVDGQTLLAGGTIDLGTAWGLVDTRPVRSLTSLPDLDADGRDELLIGSQWSATAGREGRFDLFLSTQLAAGGQHDAADAWVSVVGEGFNAHLGSDAAPLDDLDGDGHPELAVAALGHSGTAGQVLVLSGADLQSGGALTYSDALLAIGSAALESFATIASVADIDGDGAAELAIGLGHSQWHTAVFAGAQLVPGGSLDSSQAQWWVTREVLGSSHWLRGGRSIVSGDLDGDGLGDLLVGTGTAGLGRTYLISGGGLATALPTGGTTAIEAVSLSFWEPDPLLPTALGRSLGIADATGDGIPDAIVGANADNGSGPGGVHIIPGPF